jgi:hypothetical protein
MDQRDIGIVLDPIVVSKLQTKRDAADARLFGKPPNFRIAFAILQRLSVWTIVLTELSLLFRGAMEALYIGAAAPFARAVVVSTDMLMKPFGGMLPPYQLAHRVFVDANIPLAMFVYLLAGVLVLRALAPLRSA